MEIKVNVQTSNDKVRYIPMEVTKETIMDFGIEKTKVRRMKIGYKRFWVFLVSATEEQYSEYMRPWWRELKREERHGNNVSTDWLYGESNFEFADSNEDVEDAVIHGELIEALHRALDELEELDRRIMLMFASGSSEAEIGRTVGMSQTGVGRRKRKILSLLRELLKDYR